MEHIIQLHIEKLPEGVYLVTSDDVQGLIAQGRTIQETIDITREGFEWALAHSCLSHAEPSMSKEGRMGTCKK